MAATAGIRLLRRSHEQLAAFGDSSGGIHLPHRSVAVVEIDRQARTSGAGPCTGDVARCRTMASLTADVYFRPRGLEGFAFHAVVFLQIGGMTFGAHVVPVLFTSGPVQWILVRNEFLRIDVVPALAALSAAPGIPGDRQHLHVTIGHLDQVLLQRRNAKRVFDREHLEFTICIVSSNQEVAATFEKSGGHVEILKLDTGKISQDALGRDLLHRQRVMRILPKLELRRVALPACLRSGEARRFRCGPRRCRRVTGNHEEKQRGSTKNSIGNQ